MVDDNALGLDARKLVLENEGYRVIAKPTPEEALEAISSQHFDLLITDYIMPGMNGDELIRRVRNRGIKTPAILLSGFVDPLGLHEANTGADVVVQKSNHEINHLLRAVRTVLRAGAPARKGVTSERPSRAARKKA